MSTIRDFKMPDLGEGLEDGEIIEWFVAVGDQVDLNQTLVAVESAKATVELPSPFSGTVVELCGASGESVAVGAALIRIETGGASDSPTTNGAAPPVENASSAKIAQPGGSDPRPLVGYGANEASGVRATRGIVRSTEGTTASPHPAALSSSKLVDNPTQSFPRAKPPVRKLARDLGVDLAQLSPGSGREGTVTRADVEAAAQGVGPVRAPAAQTPSGSSSHTADVVFGFRGRVPGEVEQVRGIRKRIIEKMELSRRTIPHASASRDADLTEFWRLRSVLGAQAASEGYSVKITPLSLICKAAILALRRFPTLHSRYDAQAGEITLLGSVNLGLAVDTERGLLVANIKDAHTKSLVEIASATVDLAERCRSGKATPAELTGGTFTVNNYGFFGNDDGDPIINAPEAAILGVGAIRERPWVVDGQLAVRRVARLNLVFDHRVCDGGEAARFINYLADLCEEPIRLLLH